jgi:hypothetical protein
MPNSSALARLDDTVTRLDSVIDARLRRVEEQQAREDAARADAARARYRADANDCREHAARYDGSFAAFGVETPPPRDGEDPDDFRCRLFRRLLKRLPDDHSLQGIDPSELPATALNNLEEQLIRDAAAEGANPSEANLPPDGSMISRARVDADTGSKTTEFFGKRSFIADLTRPGRKVLRLIDPASGRVLLGAPFSSR